MITDIVDETGAAYSAQDVFDQLNDSGFYQNLKGASEMGDKKFVKGFFAKRNPNSPDFVIANIGIKVSDITEFLNENVKDNGFVNIDIKKSRDGNLYADLNDWEKSE